MFNTTSQKTEINNPANGIIQRSNEKSFFLTFHQKSQLEREIFSKKPTYKNKDVSVLQVLLINDGYFLAEIVNSEEL